MDDGTRMLEQRGRAAGHTRPRLPSSATEATGVDDEALMARFREGDHEAFEELYERYESRLYGFCLRFLGDATQAEDAFQDVMTAVIERRRRYERRGRFRSWLFTIARNVCLDRTKKRRRRGELLSLVKRNGPARSASAEVTLEARDELAQMLSALPSDQREIVLLHRYEGFSYAEIAEILGTSEAAAKQKAYRALLSVRKTARR